jgi:hypothetical protein
MSKRGENFSCEEKSYISELARQRKNILECKKYHGKTIKNKNETWAKIVTELHARFPEKHMRKVKQVKDLWRRIKIKAKDDATRSRQARRQTGGGPAEPPLSQETQVVMDAVGEDAIVPPPNPYDDDAANDVQQTEETAANDVQQTEETATEGAGTIDHEEGVDEEEQDEVDDADAAEMVDVEEATEPDATQTNRGLCD